MKSTLLLLLSTLATCLQFNVANSEDGKTFTCSPNGVTQLDGSYGQLHIVRNETSCVFSAPKTSKFLALKLTDIALEANDKLSISSDKEAGKSITLTAPMDTGFVVSGLQSPSVTFSFSNLSATAMDVEFMLDPQSISINGDTNNEVTIKSIALMSLNIQFIKTVTDIIHFEVIGATIKDGTHPNHALLEKPTTINLVLVPDQLVTIRTSPVLGKCSGTYATKTDQKYHLQGPSAEKYRKTYKCVNLFSKPVDAANFVVDFNNFIDVVDDDDQLIVDDGQSDSSLYIVKSGASEYTGQQKHFSGQSGLAVIYNSPRVVHPNNIQFELNVVSRSNVVIVDKAQPSLQLSKQIQYVLRPQREEYASIQSSGLDLKGASLTISTDHNARTKLISLPPVVVVNEPGRQMILEYNSTKPGGSVAYKPLTSSCHHLSTTTSDGFSVSNVVGSCIWTVAPNEPVILKFDYIHLPSGCLTLISSPATQIFSRCNLESSDVLPPFVINQGYVNVTLSSNTSRLDATLSRNPIQGANNVSLSRSSTITSSNYPVAYPYSRQNSKYVIDALNRSYALTVIDLDLRNGEKMSIDRSEISMRNRLNQGVIDISNKVTNILVDRSGVSEDLTNHRGFKLQAEQFDKFIEVNKSPFKTPANLTSVLLRISTSKSTTFGKRIKYNMTFASATERYNITIIDSTVLNGRQININKFHNQSTSDTLLVKYVATAPGVLLPVATLEYELMSCNSTSDHICDNGTRCVPKENFCIGAPYCDDKTDLKYCGGAAIPVPEPKIIETGVGGVTVFLVSVMMLVIGALSALYGPDLARDLEARFRSGQYTTFTSSD